MDPREILRLRLIDPDFNIDFMLNYDYGNQMFGVKLIVSMLPILRVVELLSFKMVNNRYTSLGSVREFKRKEGPIFSLDGVKFLCNIPTTFYVHVRNLVTDCVVIYELF